MLNQLEIATNLLNAPVNGDFVPLMIIETDAGRFDVHLLLAVGQTHRQRDTAVAQRQIQIVGIVA